MKKHLILAAMLCVTPWVFADTVHFSDGSYLDGVVSYPDSETIMIDIVTRKLSFSTSLVSRVESNSKTGDESQVTEALAKQQKIALEVRTGMTEEERDRVRAAMSPLWSDDEAKRNDARRKLADLNKELPVFQYIDASLPYTKGTVAPELLRVLVELDADNAKDVLSRFTINPDPAIRATVLELLATYKDADDVETIADGTIDLEQSVRFRAARALGVCGHKTATPVLLKGMESSDPQLRNASKSALQDIWASDSAAANLDTVEQWKEFWNVKSASVENAIDPAKLTLLVTQEDIDKATASHDE
ncbi:MAG TPA: HEAT repeat domain-containing protein [Candidatus Hydrogenedentes bacterium]|mgnify:FL=1|nr:HEAT repeat domain-containing protein [Candidatus Hydrogenedentota bacterium]HRT20868.1 HEAT repeat domain-containing protein [Candidatus Hydrogenedentota bacterium]HRT66823.1 HEAT repeat domain-containing protein [Candidatus Hydrogenedentota bacterium]